MICILETNKNEHVCKLQRLRRISETYLKIHLPENTVLPENTLRILKISIENYANFSEVIPETPNKTYAKFAKSTSAIRYNNLLNTTSEFISISQIFNSGTKS